MLLEKTKKHKLAQINNKVQGRFTYWVRTCHADLGTLILSVLHRPMVSFTARVNTLLFKQVSESQQDGGTSTRIGIQEI